MKKEKTRKGIKKNLRFEIAASAYGGLAMTTAVSLRAEGEAISNTR